MVANPPRGYPRVTPYLLYEDPAAALGWLGSAFGLRERFRHELDGVINHAEMEFEDGLVMLANPGGAYRSPRRLGQATAITHIYVPGLYSHFERANEAGRRDSHGADGEAVRDDSVFGDRPGGARMALLGASP